MRYKTWYTVKEFADALADAGIYLQEATIRIYLKNGKIKGDKPVGRWRVHKSELEKLVGR